MITLYRIPRQTLRGDGVYESFDMGELRASFFGIRIPVRLAQWVNRWL